MKTSTPETITPFVEVLSSVLSILSPATEEEDPFLTEPSKPKQSPVLQVLAPSILDTISSLTLEQANPVKDLLDPIIESLRQYSTLFRPSPPKNRKAILLSMRTSQTRLAQWSAAWSDGFAIPAGVDLRCLSAGIKSCGATVMIRHIVNEMWSIEGAYGFHAGVLYTDIANIVATAAMFLTIPFDIGFGVENFGERYLFMTPDEKDMEMGRSYRLLTELVTQVIGWTEGKDGIKRQDDGMTVDS
jgi:hypothetical protein